MQVQVAVYLEAWAKDKKYDRLGTDDTTVEIGGVDVPQIKIPVKLVEMLRSLSKSLP